MQPDDREPPLKKIRLSRDNFFDEDKFALEEIDKLRRKLAEKEHRVMVPRDSSSGDVSSLRAQQPSEVSKSDQNSFSVFVLDTDKRLFAAEVTGSRTLWSIVEGLASRGCQGVQPGTLLHCSGQVQGDVHITVEEAGLKEDCTISLARAGCTERWQAFAEMEAAFYKLHGFYQHVISSDQPSFANLFQQLQDCCKAAHKAQTSFYAADNEPGALEDILLSNLETDCIPLWRLPESCLLPDVVSWTFSPSALSIFGVLLLCCNKSFIGVYVLLLVLSCAEHLCDGREHEPSDNRKILGELRWECYKRLVGVEHSATGALCEATTHKDPALFPYIFLVILQLTHSQIKFCQSLSDQTTIRQVQLLAEKCLWVNTPWSSWSDLLPSALFDASAQHRIMTQLARCVATAVKEISQAMVELRQQVMSRDLEQYKLQPHGSLTGLELCASCSTLIEMFLALHHKLIETGGPEIADMMESFHAMLLTVMQTVKAVEGFGDICIRLGIATNNTAKDPYTGEPLSDPKPDPYVSVTPAVLRDNLAGLYPGIHAMCSSKFGRDRMPILCQQAGGVNGNKGWLYVPNYLEQILQWAVPPAVLKVQHLKPNGVLHHACITPPAEGEEFQEQLPESVRKQYLYELFPDLSVEANWEDEPDHQELIVPREELGDCLYTGNVSLHTHYTRGLYVTFKDELGRGSGVMKEWMGLVAKHHFGKYGGVFKPCPSDPATVHPIRFPGSENDWEDGVHFMRNAGKFAGLALCYRCPIGIKLSTACLKMMTGRRTRLADFEEVEPEMYRTMQAIQAACREEELQAMDLTFETPEGAAFENQGDEPVGAAVTLENKQQFLECLFHHFLDCSEEVSYFLEGLCSMAEWDSWHPTYAEESDRDQQNMLRPLVVGDFSKHLAGKLTPLDVREWQNATTFNSFFHFPKAFQDADWFWEMVEGMDEQRRRQLLAFWTSMSTVPIGGFAELSSKLKLQSTSQAQALPTSHTCFFQLNLPHYNSLEEMTAAFSTALNESQGFAFG